MRVREEPDREGETTRVVRGTLGALQVATVDGPISNDTMSYGYDALGRVITRFLNGTGTTITYDALGRVSALAFPIGTFTYGFDGVTDRVTSVSYPNQQTSSYTYAGLTADF